MSQQQAAIARPKERLTALRSGEAAGHSEHCKKSFTENKIRAPSGTLFGTRVSVNLEVDTDSAHDTPLGGVK